MMRKKRQISHQFALLTMDIKTDNFWHQVFISIARAYNATNLKLTSHFEKQIQGAIEEA